MRRFARMVLSISVGLAVIIGSLLLVSRADARPNVVESLGFGICGYRPCFLGIAPSVTQWTEITPELLNQNTIQSVSWAGPQNMSFFASGLGIALTGQNNSNAVSMVKISIYKRQRVQLGDFVRFYGLPCAEAAASTGQIEFLYPYMTVLINTYQNGIDLTASVFRVEMIDVASQYPGVTNWCAMAQKYGTNSPFRTMEPYNWLRWNGN